MICNKCLIEKDSDYFEFRKDRMSFRKTCKDCRKDSLNSKRKCILEKKNELLSLSIIDSSKEDFFNYCKSRNFKLNMPLVDDFINQKFDIVLDFKTKVYLYYCDLKSPPLCNYCKFRYTNLINTSVGFHKFCSPKCASNSDEKKEKVGDTNLKRYGYVTPLCNDFIKSKIKKSNLEKYGYENVSFVESVKERKSKTMFSKFGVEFNSQRLEVRDSLSNRMSILNNKMNSIRHEDYWISKLSDMNLNLVCRAGSIVTIRCPYKDHDFSIHKTTFNDRVENGTPICTVCNPVSDSKSFKEKEISEWIRNIYSGLVIDSYRDGLEIDIYLPDIKIGFEFNGLYWHSNKFKDKNYHLNKTNYFLDRGVRIVHIWEDDWIFKKDIIKSQIINLIGVSERIPARKCKVMLMEDSKLVKEFLDRNHVQGFVTSKVKIGLLYNDEIVSLMVFDQFEGRKKMKEDEWNLSRFCSSLGISVVGGASKIISFFVKNYHPKRIISYSDRSWSNGNLYFMLGFSKVSSGYPDYKYIIDNKRFHKSGFRRSKIGMSESCLGYPKIYDCGRSKFELVLV
jgi:hypothetical protein